jgi:hypothetical protein
MNEKTNACLQPMQEEKVISETLVDIMQAELRTRELLFSTHILFFNDCEQAPDFPDPSCHLDKIEQIKEISRFNAELANLLLQKLK